jgi:hypothetical protein
MVAPKELEGHGALVDPCLAKVKRCTRIARRPLVTEEKCLDADGFVKSGNHQPHYFHFVNSSMHKLKHPDMHEENEEGEMMGLGKPPGWMFNGHMHFVLCSPRVERDLDNSKVSACFSNRRRELKRGKGQSR